MLQYLALAFVGQGKSVPDSVPAVIEVKMSAVQASGETPEWTSMLKPSAEQWFREHDKSWKVLPFKECKIELTFPNDWPKQSQVSGAPGRRGHFVKIIVTGSGSGKSLSQENSYVWGDGMWSKGAKFTHRVSVEVGVASYVDISLRRFCGWASREIKKKS